MATLSAIYGADPLDNDDVSNIAFSNDTDETDNTTALDNTPSDFGTMDDTSFQIHVRYKLSGTHAGSDTYALLAGIRNSGDTAFLAGASTSAAQSIDADVTNDTIQQADISLPAAGVDNTADKAAWDAATVWIQQDYTQDMGKDGLHIIVYQVWITGNYTAAPSTINISGTCDIAIETTGVVREQVNLSGDSDIAIGYIGTNFYDKVRDTGSGVYLDVADHTTLQDTDDYSIRVELMVPEWSTIISDDAVWEARISGSNEYWRCLIRPTEGQFRFDTRISGVFESNQSPTFSYGEGDRFAMRVDFQAGTIRWYEAAHIDGPWTQVGTDQAHARSVLPSVGGTGDRRIGARDGTQNRVRTRYYRVQIVDLDDDSMPVDIDLTNRSQAEIDAGSFTEDGPNSLTVTFTGTYGTGEWVYTRIPVVKAISKPTGTSEAAITTGLSKLLTKAEMTLQSYGGSGNWLDETANAHDGTITGALFKPFPEPHLYADEGNPSGYAEIGDHASFDLSGDTTWFLDFTQDELPVVTTNDTIIARSQGLGSPGNHWIIYTQTTGNFGFDTYDSGGVFKYGHTAPYSELLQNYQAGDRIQVKIVFDVDNGGGNEEFWIYHRAYRGQDLLDPTGWTEARNETRSGTHSWGADATPLWFHHRTTQYLDKNGIFRFVWKTGLDETGTTIVDVDFTKVTPQDEATGWNEDGPNALGVSLQGTGVAIRRPEKYVYMPGTGGNTLSTPSSTPLQVTGDIEFRFDGTAPDWSIGSQQSFGGKWGGTGGVDQSYRCGVNATGEPFVDVYDTTANWTVASGAAFTDGERTQIRITLDLDDGANRRAKFYERTAIRDLADDTGWTQIGSDITGTQVGTLDSNSQQVRVGAQGNDANRFIGDIYRFMIYDGIGGTVVFDGVLEDAEEPFSTFTERANGATVTINRSTAAAGMRATVIDQPVFLLDGSGDYIEVAESDNLDFDNSTSNTMAVVFRANFTDSSNDRLLFKRNSTDTGDAGWHMRINGATTPDSVNVGVSDGTTARSLNNTTQGISPLVRSIGVMRLEAAQAGGMTNWVDGVEHTNPSDLQDLGSMNNALAVRIGAQTAATNELNGEIMAAVLWRTALTDAQIAHLERELFPELVTVLEQTNAISGSVDISVTTSGDVTQTHDVAGSSDISISATGTLLVEGAIPIDGTSAISIAATGAVTQTHPLAGASDLALTTTGAATQTHEISGSTSAVISTAGELDQIQKVTGTSALAISSTATLIQIHDLTGTVDLSFTTTGAATQTQELSGSSSLAVISTTGELEQIQKATGTSALAISSTATLTQTHDISGTINLAISAVGALEEIEKVGGVLDVAITTTGGITQTQNLSGTSDLAIAATGTTKVLIGLAGTASFAISTTAVVKEIETLAGTINIGISATGDVTQTQPLSGTLDLALTTTGALDQIHELAGSSSVSISATATLTQTQEISGTADVALSTTGTTTQIQPLSGSVDTALATTGNAEQIHYIGYSWYYAEGYGPSFDLYITTTGALFQSGGIAGSSSIAISTTGALAQTQRLSGTSDLALSTTGAATQTAKVAGTSDLALTTTGNISQARSISGTSAIAISTTGALTQTQRLAGSSSLALTVTGAVVEVEKIGGVLDISITTTGALEQTHALAGTSDVALTTTGTIDAVIELAGTSGLALSTTVALAQTHKLAGTSDLAISAQGGMGSKNITGTATLSITTTGALVQIQRLAGTSDLALSASGIVSTAQTILLSGTSSFAITATGGIEELEKVAGIIDVAISTIGGITQTQALGGSAIVSVDVTGIVTQLIEIAGTVQTAFTATGTITVIHELTGSTQFSFTATGVLYQAVPGISGTITLSITTTGTITNSFLVIKAFVTLSDSVVSGLTVTDSRVSGATVSDESTTTLTLTDW